VILVEIPDVVLASGSAGRQRLLEAAGIVCAVDPADVDEEACQTSDPIERATELARSKLEIVQERHPDSLVLAADQVAHLEGVTFGKPRSPEDHLEMLRGLVGKRHELVTAVALGWGSERVEFHEITGIRFRADITEAELESYVRQGEGAGCAGGYRVESLGPWLIQEVQGDWFNVVGLPIPRLVTELRRMGFRLDHVACTRVHG